MNKTRGHILWVDDEIHHLKPHILFLEQKGYIIHKTTNGKDAVEMVKKQSYVLVLLDQSMPGIDGLETHNQIKKVNATIPVIMITKTEDEWLMDEALTGSVEQFLIKPVNPSQIFMACKQVLESGRLTKQKISNQYLKDFQEFESMLDGSLQIDGWWSLYDRLSGWQIKFDQHVDTGLESIIEEQIQTCNREFSAFIESKYRDWIWSEDRPVMSTDVIGKTVKPLLDKSEKVCFIVVDCMRHDQFKSLMPIFESMFNIEVDYKLSLLPSATPYSRNAIFSGLFPDQMVKKYPEQQKAMEKHEAGLNQLENFFLIDQLERLELKHLTTHYHKIWAFEEGKKFEKYILNLLKKDLIALVVNFVDLLAHSSSQTIVLKEIVQDEKGYRKAVKSWLEESWLLHILKILSKNKFTVVITSDHGSIRVNKEAMVAADRGASSGVRYKFGRNLNTNKRNALIIDNPADFRLPAFGPQPSYIIAKDDNFFVYPNQSNKYSAKFKNSFQHGGISMEEMMVPVAVMKPRI